MTTRDLITEALQDLAVLMPGDPLDDTEATAALSKVTRILDNWNAERAGVYASRQTTYTLVPDLQPHTIGPAASSPTFTVTQRPVSIEWANLLLSGGALDVYLPLNLRDADWFSALSVPGLSTDIPTDLYYSPEWPLGRLYFWPVPAAAYQMQLRTRIVLADLALDDDVSLPPGYRDALTLTLGEMLAPVYPPAHADPVAAATARARIFANNDVTPRLATADYTSRASRPAWTTLNFYRGY